MHVREVYGQRAQAMGAALKRERSDAISFTQPGGGLFFWAWLTGANGKLAEANVLAKRAIKKASGLRARRAVLCREARHGHAA